MSHGPFGALATELVRGSAAQKTDCISPLRDIPTGNDRILLDAAAALRSRLRERRADVPSLECREAAICNLGIVRPQAALKVRR